MSHTLPRCGTDLDSTAVVFGAVLKRLFRRWNLTLGTLFACFRFREFLPSQMGGIACERERG